MANNLCWRKCIIVHISLHIITKYIINGHTRLLLEANKEIKANVIMCNTMTNITMLLIFTFDGKGYEIAQLMSNDT